MNLILLVSEALFIYPLQVLRKMTRLPKGNEVFIPFVFFFTIVAVSAFELSAKNTAWMIIAILAFLIAIIIVSLAHRIPVIENPELVNHFNSLCAEGALIRFRSIMAKFCLYCLLGFFGLMYAELTTSSLFILVIGGAMQSFNLAVLAWRESKQPT